MKYIKRAKRGLVEKKTGRKIVSPLDSMVRFLHERSETLLKKYIIKIILNDIHSLGPITYALIEQLRRHKPLIRE